MTLLNDKDLEAMRSTQEQHMLETVYIQRLVRTDDNSGGWYESWQTVQETKGRIGIPTSAELAIAGSLNAVNSFTITLPADTDLLETDQLQISGVEYRINAILKRSQKTALRVLVTQI